MNDKALITLIFISLVCCEAIILCSIPQVRANGTIPEKYSQELNLDSVYMYNVSKFDSQFTWWDLDWMKPPKGVAYTNPGGQITMNITGFYNKTSADYSCSEDPIPYSNIKFFENQSHVLVANLSLNNVSASEVAMNLAIGYSNFLYGFLIPIDNFSKLKTQAYAQNSGSYAASVTIEETYNYLYIDFKQNTKAQNSSTLYDKQTGLLIWAKVENIYGPDLEITLTNYSFNYAPSYLYNVSKFDSLFTWWDLDWAAPSKGTAYTNPGGVIIVNFTGMFAKYSYDYSCFSGLHPYLNISLFENRSNALVANFTLFNVSNSEVSMNLAIGYSAFLSGFFVPIDNLSKLKEDAYAQNTGSYAASINVVETNLTIMFIFKQDSRAQNTSMIYEKRTGLLLWSKVENIYGPDLEITINGYIPWSLPEDIPPTPNEGDDDDDFDKLKEKGTEETATLTQIIIVISIGFVIAIIVISIILLRRKE